MIASKVRQIARLATRKIRLRYLRNVETAAEIETQNRVLALLDSLPDGVEGIAMRDLHKVLAVSQPKVLRAVRDLEESGLVTVETVLHDPLASLIVLTR